MNDVLAERLNDIYPDFVGRSGNDRVTTIGFETDSGWYPLLASLFTQLRALSEQSGKRFTARQIKEKFGELRVYFCDRYGFGCIQHCLAIWRFGGVASVRFADVQAPDRKREDGFVIVVSCTKLSALL